jgi:glycosyltransferase involved in cell wall biosynthesis
MKIGIDAFPLAGRIAGIGRYVLEISHALDVFLPEAEFFLYSPEQLTVEPPSARWHIRIGGSRFPSSYRWLKTAVREMAINDGIDVFWATRTILPAHSERFHTLTTVHDLNYLVFPQSMPYVTRWAHRLWFARDVRRADTVVTNSQGTADRLREMLGVAATAVARPGVKPPFGPQDPSHITKKLAGLGVEKPYFLAVGTLEPRKNLPALIDAFVSLKLSNELPFHQLLIAGDRGWRGRRLFALLREAERHGVRWLGFVSDEDLAALYAGSTAFVFPSLYEGFGIPAVEARSCGARVIASNLPELHEAVEGDALFIEPTAMALRKALRRVAEQPGCLSKPRTIPTWTEAAKVMADQFRKLV